jgi:hypothetical protein
LTSSFRDALKAQTRNLAAFNHFWIPGSLVFLAPTDAQLRIGE